MPYIGYNSCHARVISSDTIVDERLFDSMDASSVTEDSQSGMVVDGLRYTFRVRISFFDNRTPETHVAHFQISCYIGGGTTPTADFYVEFEEEAH